RRSCTPRRWSVNDGWSVSSSFGDGGGGGWSRQMKASGDVLGGVVRAMVLGDLVMASVRLTMMVWEFK
ncbi:hypothetical protein Dimus_017306, partial [Dionaea muscipula]